MTHRLTAAASSLVLLIAAHRDAPAESLSAGLETKFIAACSHRFAGGSKQGAELKEGCQCLYGILKETADEKQIALITALWGGDESAAKNAMTSLSPPDKARLQAMLENFAKLSGQRCAGSK